MPYIFTFNELFIYSLFVAFVGFFFGCVICTVITEYYRQIGYEYKKELARQEFRKLCEKEN